MELSNIIGLIGLSIFLILGCLIFSDLYKSKKRNISKSKKKSSFKKQEKK